MTDITTEVIMMMWNDSMRTFINSTDGSDIDRHTFIHMLMTDIRTEVILTIWRQGRAWSDSMRTYISSTDASDIDRQTYIHLY